MKSMTLRRILLLPNTGLNYSKCFVMHDMLYLLNDFANLTLSFIFYFSLIFQELQVITVVL